MRPLKLLFPAASLLHAQAQAEHLFDAIEQELIRPGISESALSEAIYALAEARFGVTTHWHKRVVRSGPNTLLTYAADPADRVIEPDDILFVDLGPVFEEWEADFGRTFVLGDDPVKHKLRDDLAPIFAAAKAAYQAQPDMTGAALYRLACDLATKAGWEFGGTIAGHLVGQFPHEAIPGDKITLYITPGNNQPLNRPDAAGNERNWILEIHLVDRARGIGAFCESLLTLG
jgi:Xaa-Pro aminopeptidase